MAELHEDRSLVLTAMFEALWQLGLIGPLALVSALAAIVALVAFCVVFRTQVDAKLVLAQLRRLVRAGNAERALKLTKALDAPALLLARAGLAAALAGEAARDAAAPGGYRERAAELRTPKQRCDEALEVTHNALRDRLRRGFLPALACLLVALACWLAALLTALQAGGFAHDALPALALLLFVLLLGYGGALNARLRYDVQLVETRTAVSALAAEPALVAVVRPVS